MSFEPVLPPYNATDPTATFLSSSCLDLLLIELVPMAYRVTNELEAASTSSAILPPTAAQQQNPVTSSDSVSVSTAAAAATVPGSKRVMDEEEERDAVFYRLETLGYRVGQGLVERYVALSLSLFLPFAPMPEKLPSGGGCFQVTRRWTNYYYVALGCRFSRDRPRFNDTLDVIKFICKDLWTLVFRKQVDNLKTNHRVG